jgi:hypothetical protein
MPVPRKWADMPISIYVNNLVMAPLSLEKKIDAILVNTIFSLIVGIIAGIGSMLRFQIDVENSLIIGCLSAIAYFFISIAAGIIVIIFWNSHK